MPAMWHWPTTLWRFLLVETLRLLLVTALVVVVVASFAVAIRFIANGTLGPLDGLRLMGLAAVPMLQYALPFAGGFAATLAYHRMSQDNELTAVYAGGISHRRALVPAALTGLVLGGALFFLADQVMPRLLRKMQELVADDATRLLQSAIARGVAIERAGRVLYADGLEVLPVEPGSGAYRHFLLRGVVAAELDSQRRVTREFAAPLARVWLFHSAIAGLEQPSTGAARGRWDASADSATTVVMRLKDPLGAMGERAIGEAEHTEIRFTLPSAFADDPKYLTWAELARASQRPETLNIVDQPRRRLAGVLTQRQVQDALGAELTARGAARFADEAGRAVLLRARALAGAPDAKGWRVEPALDGHIDVEISEQGRALRTHRSARAWVSAWRGAEQGAGPESLTLRLENVRTIVAPRGAGGAQGTPPAGEAEGARDADAEPTGTLLELDLPGLRPGAWTAGQSAPDALEMPVEGLIGAARARAQGAEQARDTELLRWADRLEGAVTDLRREVLSKQHERIATSLACVVMVLLGAVMGLKLAGSSPLVVYVWSFLPAIGALVSIAGGQSVTHDQGALGLLLLYGGVVALGLYTLWEYRQVARH
jgi:lipopolysaccharide export LptBFGC system permease protein LptF